MLLKCKIIITILFKQEETNQRGRPKPFTLIKKSPFFPLQSSLHFVLEPPPHTCKEKTLNLLSMATDPTLLHQLSLLLQSKRKDAKRKGMERYIEKGRGENERCIEKKGRGGQRMQRAKFNFRFRVRKSILFIGVFFLSASLVEPVRFGSIGFKL